ncbi:hypothetical protein ACFY5C_06900 [Streptomyces sp. NPDC012935]|uniref:hypothetical protein n=1 Tax=Streptomyces sp. NPDC012935 TaxID=3364857 RepID=UPI00367FCE04
MYTRGPGVRFTVVSAMAVLALTGFSSGCGAGSRGDAGSSSGSSGSDAHASGASTGGEGTHRSQPTHSPTPTASPSNETARPLKDGTAVVMSCASTDDPYATVEIRNPNGRAGIFTVRINFKDEHGFTLLETGNQVPVPAKGTTTHRVAVAGAGRVDEIDRCEVDPRATADQ